MLQNRFSIYTVGLLLFFAGLACSLVPEGTVTDDQRLVRPERPALLLLTPQQGSRYALGTPVIFHAIAQDAVGINRLEVHIDQPETPLVLTHVIDPPATEVEVLLPWMPPNSQLYLISVLAFREAGSPSDPSDDIPSNEILLSIDVLPSSQVAPPPPFTPEVVPSSTITVDNALPSISAVITSTDSVLVRQGPGIQYQAVQTLNNGDILSVVGRSEDGIWLVIELPNGFGWIIREAVVLNGAIEDLAVVAAPPLTENE
ncbi:MAG: hypothetical protein CUN55_01195 [Phototrophicales bacterium]|nr:MAG: hypothetical protein CUN55_01195 [Phototrophicales bacterium]